MLYKCSAYAVGGNMLRSFLKNPSPFKNLAHTVTFDYDFLSKYFHSIFLSSLLPDRLSISTCTTWRRYLNGKASLKLREGEGI